MSSTANYPDDIPPPSDWDAAWAIAWAIARGEFRIDRIWRDDLIAVGTIHMIGSGDGWSRQHWSVTPGHSCYQHYVAALEGAEMNALPPPARTATQEGRCAVRLTTRGTVVVAAFASVATSMIMTLLSPLRSTR